MRQIDVPKIKDGFLLVRVHAAGVNQFDHEVVTGEVKDWMPVSFPYIPGMDGAGVVAEIGKGVDGWNKGDAVLGMFPSGTFAEYALISAVDKKLARKPTNLEFDRAAVIPESGMTANTIIRAAKVQPNQKVLIIGATGGVGLFTTQLANAQGAHVIATGKAGDVDYLKQLGAKDVIDYSAGDTIEQTQRRYPEGVDVVVDLINENDALLRDAKVLRPRGTLVSSLSGPDQAAFPTGVTVHYIEMAAESGDLQDLAQRAADGSLRVEIGETYDLSHAAQALSDIKDPKKHTRGKLVIRVT